MHLNAYMYILFTSYNSTHYLRFKLKRHFAPVFSCVVVRQTQNSKI